MTIALLLIVLAFGLVIASAVGKCPLWIPVLLLALERLVAIVPLR
jgi:hypothetical protein